MFASQEIEDIGLGDQKEPFTISKSALSEDFAEKTTHLASKVGVAKLNPPGVRKNHPLSPSNLASSF